MKAIIEILKNYKFVKKDFYLSLITRSLLGLILLYLPTLTRKILEVVELKWSLEELYNSIWMLAIFTLFGSQYNTII